VLEGNSAPLNSEHCAPWRPVMVASAHDLPVVLD